MTNPTRTQPVVSKYTTLQLKRIERAAQHRNISVAEYQRRVTLGITMRGHIDGALERFQSYALDRRDTISGGKQRRLAEKRGIDLDIDAECPELSASSGA
jgi:hypothetical protein